MFFSKTTISAALVAAVNGHMVMNSPAPFNPEGLNNSPLDASGSDFPCKFNGVYTATGGTTNTYELGSSQSLAFTGSAVHGGGSCQVVMTYDNPPTKDSTWKVIHSIEGGCPAKNTAGNLPENPDGADPFGYQFKVPSDIPTGKGTIGWTWFNRIGNREMYMNCGALELTGTSGDQSNFDSLPDMVVLNIGDYPKTPEGVDYKFARPGPSVENNIGAYGVATCDTTGCQDGDTGGSDSGSAPSPTAPGNGGGVFLTTGTPSTFTSSVTPSSSVAPSSSAVVTTTAAAPTTTAAAPTTTAAAPTTTSAASSAPPTPTSVPDNGSGSGSAGTLSGACATEGMWNCINGKSYQQCGSGQWSTVMAMPAGTVCTLGQNMDLGMIAAGRKVRSFRA